MPKSDPASQPRVPFVTLVSRMRVLLAYLLLPNLAFWFAGHVFETLPRAAINLDYLLIAVFVPFLKKWQSTALLSFTVLLDLARSFGPLYYFSQRDALDALVFLHEVSITHVAVGVMTVVIPALALGWLMMRVGGVSTVPRRSTSWLVVLVVVLGAIGVWGGNSSLRFRERASGMNLCTSAGGSMGKTIAAALFRKHDRVMPLPVDSATRRAGWFTKIPEARNLVLVVVESGGEPVNPAWKALLQSEWANPTLQERYLVETGSIHFTGATVPGEFRELCGVLSGVLETPANDTALMRACLGSEMQRQGFMTMYVHGFAPEMFNRRDWISRLGFDQEFFHPQLHDLGLPDCGGPFRGTCDASVAQWIGDRLSADFDHRHLVYWLTLNSHLPVFKDPEASAALHCGDAASPVGEEASCDLIALILRVEHSVVELALRSDLPKTEFVIVGDHAPPFIFKQRRELFSQDEVPYVHLKPLQ